MCALADARACISYKAALPHCCNALHRAAVGAVPRGQLEAWLQSHCRPLLSAVDAATMLDLLLQHTFGACVLCAHHMARDGSYSPARTVVFSPATNTHM